jgi:hypothetical protein
MSVPRRPPLKRRARGRLFTGTYGCRSLMFSAIPALLFGRDLLIRCVMRPCVVCRNTVCCCHEARPTISEHFPSLSHIQEHLAVFFDFRLSCEHPAVLRVLAIICRFLHPPTAPSGQIVAHGGREPFQIHLPSHAATRPSIPPAKRVNVASLGIPYRCFRHVGHDANSCVLALQHAELLLLSEEKSGLANADRPFVARMIVWGAAPQSQASLPWKYCAGAARPPQFRLVAALDQEQQPAHIHSGIVALL